MAPARMDLRETGSFESAVMRTLQVDVVRTERKAGRAGPVTKAIVTSGEDSVGE